MASKTVNFHSDCDSQLECIAKWLSCNGEVWGVGPTVVFACAAAFFLYQELEATVFTTGDHVHVSTLERSLISTMVVGMLALMIHLWVCSMRFIQYYLDTIIRDSPSVILQMTTAGLLGAQSELVPLGPLTRFLRQQQPQIHITVCWFLSLCYADYVRKNYCHRFNMPYLERWQAELHEQARRGMGSTMARVNSFITTVHCRLSGAHNVHTHTVRPILRALAASLRAGIKIKMALYLRPCLDQHPLFLKLDSVKLASSAPDTQELPPIAQHQILRRLGKTSTCGSSHNQARQLLQRSKNFELSSLRPNVNAVQVLQPVTIEFKQKPTMLKNPKAIPEELPWEKTKVCAIKECKRHQKGRIILLMKQLFKSMYL